MNRKNFGSELAHLFTTLVGFVAVLFVSLLVGSAYGFVPISVLERLGVVSVSHGQGKASATRAQMYNLKSALVNYANDLGRYPHTGEKLSSATILLAQRYCLDDHASRNVLVSDSVSRPFEKHGLSDELYKKRWKGPYMDGDPDEFMRDAWDTRIKYTLAWGPAASSSPAASLVLQSAGPDGVFDPPADCLVASYAGDDLITRVSKLKLPKE